MSRALRDYCSLKGGTGFPEDLQGNADGEIPFIKVSDMSLPGNERFITKANNYLDEATANRIGANVFPPDSVVFAKVGAALLLNRRRRLTRPTIIDNNMMAAVPAGIDPEFLYHVLCTIDFARFTQPGALPSVNQSDLGAVEIADLLPEDQHRIAEILSTVDEAIEQTEALIAKTQQIKTGLMHDLFTRGVTPEGRLRPPRDQAPELYKQSPLGWIPREWEAQQLAVILEAAGGYLQTGPFGSQLHAHEYSPAGIPVIMPQDIADGEIDTSQIARIPECRARDLEKHRVREGDVVIARRGDLSRAAAVRSSQTGWVCGTGCFLLRLGGSRFNPLFAAIAYRLPLVQRQLEGMAVGTTMPSLNNSVMSDLRFPHCGPHEQELIFTRVSLIERNLAETRRYSQSLRSLKEALSQGLLCGGISAWPHQRQNTPADSVSKVPKGRESRDGN